MVKSVYGPHECASRGDDRLEQVLLDAIQRVRPVRTMRWRIASATVSDESKHAPYSVRIWRSARRTWERWGRW
ncbi:hypothetical protein B0H19DRAFT_1137678 [Mycena capillaripes]|nr:hypothetical protein B0H19DRAFT_1155816 [Mycena capillaripes]KAJ6566396.1 hypothetical protein B0H19DRAFT_1137678 [Mycena capillaripes]